jgi:hypothetical protein
MGIGVGIFLAVLGLILVTGVVQADIPFVNDYALGVILIIGGIAAIILALTVWRTSAYGAYPGRRGRVVERRVVEEGPDGPSTV